MIRGEPQVVVPMDGGFLSPDLANDGPIRKIWRIAAGTHRREKESQPVSLPREWAGPEICSSLS